MPLQLKKSFTEDEAAKLAKPVLIEDGLRPARIREARETKAQSSGRDMIVLAVDVIDDDGSERELGAAVIAGPSNVVACACGDGCISLQGGFAIATAKR